MINIFSKWKLKNFSAESLADSTSRRPLSAMDLPLDIWFLLIDTLDVYTQIQLSHTCRDLRAVATRCLPEEIRTLSPSVDCFQFMTALADRELEHFACIDCSRCHRLIPRDLPGLYRPRHCGRVPGEGTYATFFLHGGCYQLRHRHIQLALKYTSRPRLSKDYKQLLAELMAPSAHTITRRANDVLRRDSVHTELQYQAQPKIVDIGETSRGNTLRFVLREEWRYTPLDEFGRHARLRWTWNYVAREALWHLSTCTHQDFGINRYYLRRPSLDNYSLTNTVSPIVGHIEQLLDKPAGHTTSFSCGVCPTDFELRIEEDTEGVHSFVVRVWKDIGITEKEWLTRVRIDPDLFLTRREHTQGMAGEPRYMYENEKCSPCPQLCLPERRTLRLRRWLRAVFCQGS